MSFRATLTIENKEMEVLKCISQTDQEIDQKGKATSAVRGGDIRLVLSGNGEDTIPAWALNKSKKQDGTITFFKMDGLSKYREVKFEAGYVTWFAESFRPGGDDDNENFGEAIPFIDSTDKEMFELVAQAHKEFGSDYLLICKVSAKKITINDVAHDNHW